jgi:hypothetical protein
MVAARGVLSTCVRRPHGVLMLRFLSRLLHQLPVGVPTPTRNIDVHYFHLATQYYAAARWATFAISGTVAGNLFHHAVELYLKGDLSRTVYLGRLARYGHNLKRLWKVYKQKHSASTLSGFDSCIKDLDKFEAIRYPDDIVEKGMFYEIPVSHPKSTIVFQVVGSTPPTYRVVVNDIDQLIRTLFTTSSINPDFFFGKVGLEAKAVIYRDNPAFVAA